MTNIEASKLVGAIEAAWAAIQKRHEDVPDVVVTLGAGSLGVQRGTLKLGHFAVRRWVGETPEGSADPAAELFVGGEGLRRGPSALLATLLHEAAHGMASTRGIQDTSRQGRYHNQRFAALGEELGLTITQVQGIGWSGTDLAPGTAEAYADEITALGASINAYRHSEGMVPPGPGAGNGQDDGTDADGDQDEDEAPKKPKNGYSLTCDCAEPRRIRVSAKTREAGPILCGVCGSEFTEDDED